MSSAFISYSVNDEHLAKGLHSLTSMAGIETFLAGISLEPGCKWTDVIFDRLDKAEWVFFLASKSSIHSPAVQQELGASLMQKKIIIPLLIDITPEELPGWIGNHQAINLKGNQDDLRKTVAQIAEKIKVDKFWAGVIATVFVIGLVAFLSKSK